MGDKSQIQWTDATWNPTTGCRKVSPGCLNCYAVHMARRIELMQPDNAAYKGLTVLHDNGKQDWKGTVLCHPDRLSIPLKWTKPRRIFVDSMSDLFHEHVPFEFIDQVFAVMALSPQHTFQVLTKRPERMAEYLTRDPNLGADGTQYSRAYHRIFAAACEYSHERTMKAVGAGWNIGDWPLPNIWLGTSVENQQTADERIPELLKCPAAVRFLSCEPLLGAVSLWHYDEEEAALRGPGIVRSGGMTVDTPHMPAEGYDDSQPGIDWVIVGGESGPGARPFDVAWAGSLVEQCQAAGVSVFVKQLGAAPFEQDKRGGGEGWPLRLKDRKGGDIGEFPEALRVRQMPEGKAV